MLLCGWFGCAGSGVGLVGWDGTGRRGALVGQVQRVRFCAVPEAEATAKTFCFAESFCERGRACISFFMKALLRPARCSLPRWGLPDPPFIVRPSQPGPAMPRGQILAGAEVDG